MAFFNNASHHAISVFDKVYKWSPEKLHFNCIIKCFEINTNDRIYHTNSPLLTATLE